jgi:hypothetical protein
MLYDAELSGDGQDPPGQAARPRPKSALETELNQALERLDHQVEDTKNYLASLDKQSESTGLRKRRKTDAKPNGGHSR